MLKKETKRHILVYAHWHGMPEPMLMGTLHAELLRGKEIFSFEYDGVWLKSEYSHQLDTDLSLYTGPQYLNNNKSNFGLFMDSSPDRWGKLLMRRREAEIARQKKREPIHLFETDYLLGVNDGHRMGALRFKTDYDGPFLNDHKEVASPPWGSIRELEEISLRLEEDNISDDPAYLKWLSMLIAPGSSLGGSRPKASIVDSKGHLWIAKFPSRTDNTDMGAWEMVTYKLAQCAGINMAECQARKFSSKYHTFLTKRFDRSHSGERIHFASAMTLLGYMDGKNHTDGISYLELVNFINNNGVHIAQDLEQLWRRIVFSIFVTNTDDHLRNHGFILTPLGWRLSPAYDINPNEYGTGLNLNISEDDNSLNLDLAMEVQQYFRIKNKKALQIISEIRDCVKDWRKIADQMGIPRAEQEQKANAFVNDKKFAAIFTPQKYDKPEADVP